jgi:hypothetical protein
LPDQLWHTKDKELCLGRVGSLALVVTGDPWTDGAWREYCDIYAHMVALHGPARAVFNLSPRYGPTSVQRRLLIADCYHSHGLAYIRRVVVLSESAFVRAALTALQWFARNYQQARAEPPAKAAEAIAWVHERAEFEVPEAVAALGVMMDLVGHARSMLPEAFWRLG